MTQPPTSDARTTPLYDTHVASGATMTDFAGWEMPLRYGSESDEHRAVRDRGRAVRPLAHGRDPRSTARKRADCLDHALVGTTVRARRGPRPLHHDLAPSRAASWTTSSSTGWPTTSTWSSPTPLTLARWPTR